MVPILLNAAASVAGNVIDSISDHFSHHHGVRKASKTAEDDFAAELAQAQAAAPVTTAATAAASTPVDAQSTLMNQLLGTPEISSALAGANPSQPVQMEMTAAGGVYLRNANGDLHELKVSEQPRDLVTKLYSAHEPTALPGKGTPVAVLAVDPAQTATAAWSKLPARTA